MVPKKVPRLVMQGNLIRAVDVSPSKGNASPPLRGDVKGFSKASRKRMIHQCAKMGKSIPIFITLTYGKDYPSDPADWKSHLATWGKRLVRYNPALSAIWRLEPQKRGAPHYHLLVYQKNGKQPFVCKDWIAKSWSEVLGKYSNDDHLKAGTKVEALRSCRGAAFYVSKYCAKLPDDDDFKGEWERAGRLWGSFNKSCLPVAKQHEMVLHSEMEQRAVLFTMKDHFKRSFIDKRVKDYEDCPDAYHIAEADWKTAVEDNEHFGNTTTTFSSPEKFIDDLGAKIGHLEVVLSSHTGRPVRTKEINDIVDRIGSAL